MQMKGQQLLIANIHNFILRFCNYRSKEQPPGSQQERWIFELNVPKDTRGKALELPSWEPVKMVYGWVGLPRVALGAGHPVDERGEDVECVAHCAHNQAWGTKKSNSKNQAIWDLKSSFTSTST